MEGEEPGVCVTTAPEEPEGPPRTPGFIAKKKHQECPGAQG